MGTFGCLGASLATLWSGFPAPIHVHADRGSQSGTHLPIVDMHHTLHSPSGVTVTYSWTSAGYDAVAFCDRTRAALIDEVTDPRSLWIAAKWIVETAGLGGGVDDLGETLVRMLLCPERSNVEAAEEDEIAALVERLVEIRT